MTFGVFWKQAITVSNFIWVLPSYGLEEVPVPPLVGWALIQTSLLAAAALNDPSASKIAAARHTKLRDERASGDGTTIGRKVTACWEAAKLTLL